MFLRGSFYFRFSAFVFAATLIFTGCKKNGPAKYSDPFPFPKLAENNNGNRVRSLTYVNDRSSVSNVYPNLDSSVILFSYNGEGKIDRLRLTHNDMIVYDFIFQRNGSKLTSIECRTWDKYPDMYIFHPKLDLEYDGSGNVSLMKVSVDDGQNEVDSFIVKSSGNRIDTVIDRTYATGTNVDKHVITYNGAGDITAMDIMTTFGPSYTYSDMRDFTLTASPAPLSFGKEAIYWNLFANNIRRGVYSETMIPLILFHSTKQPSQLIWKTFGVSPVTSNYQTEYYSSGKPKKITADMTSASGALYAREAFYYTYSQ